MRIPLALLTIALSGFLCRPSLAEEPSAPAQAPAISELSYDKLVEAAAQLKQEKSWAKAKTLYGEALTKATTTEQRSFTELWMEDASWRAEGRPNWEKQANWRRLHQGALESMLKPYDEGQPRDDFWLAVQVSWADLENLLNDNAHWARRAQIAEFLASRPPSAAAATEYVAFLQKSLEGPAHRLEASNQPLLLLPHLQNGQRIGTTADDRAWCAWLQARLRKAALTATNQSKSGMQAFAELWNTAVTLSQGTKWETLIRAENFLWRTRLGWAPDAAPNTPADIPALLGEIKKVQASLKSEDRTQQLNDLEQQLGLLEKSLGDPKLEIIINGQFIPGAPVAFSYGSSGVGKLVFQLRQLDTADWIKSENSGAISEAKAQQLGTLIREWTKELPDANRRIWNSEVVDLGSSLQPGFYALTVLGEDPVVGKRLTPFRRFMVSGIRGIAINRMSGGGELFALSVADGSPVSGATVKGLIGIDRSTRATPWTETTDDLGRIAIPKLDGNALRLAGLIGQQPFAFSEYLNRFGEQRFIADLFLDRPLYRPGEIAHWKLILRERKDGRFVIPDKDLALKIKVRLGDETLLAPTSLTLNAFGTTHGEIQIPDTARPGYASLDLLKGDESNKQSRPQSFPLFQVDNFVAPAVVAKTELTSGAESLRPGQEMVVRVNASYFSGGPVVNVPVEGKFHINLRPEEITTQTEAQTWQRKIREETRKAMTDAQGIAEFRLPLPSFLSGVTSILFTSTVLPEGAQSAHASGTFTVTELGYTIDPLDWKKARLAKPGEKVVFKTRILDGTEAPADFEGIARLVELRWAEALLGPEGQIVSGSELSELRRRWREEFKMERTSFVQSDYLPTGWESIQAGYVERTVTESVLRVVKNDKVEIPFDLPGTGIYQLQLLRYGKRLTIKANGDWESLFRSSSEYTGKIPSEALSVIAVDEGTETLPLAPTAMTLIAPITYKPGDPFRAFAVLPSGATQAWLTVSGESKSITYPIKLKERLGFATLDKLPSLMGSGYLQLSFAYPSGNTGTQSRYFAVDRDAQELKLTLTPSSDTERPGATAQLRLAVRNAKGEPVPTEVALSVADDAVYQLVSSDRGKEKPSFLRTNRVQTVSTNSFNVLQGMVPRVIIDQRLGVLLNPLNQLFDDDLVVLSPFEVSTEGAVGYYAASSTLAGTRIQTNLNDIASAINIVTPQFLRDIGAGSIDSLLPYSSSTELGGVGDNPDEPSIEIRRHFSSTAFWSPEIMTDKDGQAQVSFKYPDNLTQWRIEAYAVGEDGISFGKTNVMTKTTLPLQARLQLPRVLVAGDSSEASVNLVNRTDSDLSVNAGLKVSGSVKANEVDKQQRKGIAVPKQAEARAFWKIDALKAGKAEFDLKAQAGKEGDAMILSLPVIEDGIQQETVATGRLAAQATDSSLSLQLPDKLNPARSQVTLQLSPSYAAAMLDALPYLIDYPYGCVEQTMSRFLPALIVRKALIDLKMEPNAVEKRILGREKATDKERREKTAGLGKIDEVTKQSLARLVEAHNNNGGFDWWPGSQQTNLWMTAYVSWGLALAKDAGIELPDKLLDETNQALVRGLSSGNTGEPNDVLAFALMAVAQQGAGSEPIKKDSQNKIFASMYDQRDKLSASGRACLALSAKVFGTPAELEVLVRNLENGAERASADGIGNTVHWGSTNHYWRAIDGAGEATALTLLALLEINPQHPLIEPAVNWLLLNRRSSHWSSTRDTTFAILALSRYINAREELSCESEIELLVNGSKFKTVRITREALLEDTLSFTVPLDLLRPGTNDLSLRRLSGSGPVYATALASSWAESDSVKPASSLIGVERSFIRKKAEPTLVGALSISLEPLASGGTASIGEEVSTRVKLKASNDLEYLMVEVPRPAGFEPLNQLSGWDARIYPIEKSKVSKNEDTNKGGRAIYREEHDDRSAFFLSRIEAGEWEIRYSLRATTAGNYRALPAKAGAMYVPEVRANSDAQRIILKRDDR